MSFTPGQWLMLVGLAAMAAGYFAFTWRQHKVGRSMIAARDRRLFPADFENLSAAERRSLYRRQSFSAAWDTTGRVLAGAGVWGLVIFIAGIVVELLGIQA